MSGVVRVPATALFAKLGSISNHTTSVCESLSGSEVRVNQIESGLPPSLRYTAFWMRADNVEIVGSSFMPSLVCWGSGAKEGPGRPRMQTRGARDQCRGATGAGDLPLAEA